MAKAQLNTIEKATLATLVFYDAFDMPLSRFEVISYLHEPSRIDRTAKKVRAAQVSDALASLEKKKMIASHNGFYHLAHKTVSGSGLFHARIEKRKIAEKKWKRINRIARFLRPLPYMRLIFGSGSLALYNTDSESDLDVLFVVRSGRIWTSRFIISAVLELLRARRTKYDKSAPDKVCPNHYVTDASLHIPRKSLYNAHLYAHLSPVAVSDRNILEQFWKENEWVRGYVSLWPPYASAPPARRSMVQRAFEYVLDGRAGDWVEQKLKAFQLKRIHADTRSIGRGRIVANDLQLEFHPYSPEAGVLARYNARMNEYGLPEWAQEKDSGLAPDKTANV